MALTGASGFVGSHVVSALRADGLPVRAVVRTTAPAAGLRSQGCEVVLADVRDRSSLRDAFAGCRAVVHLVAVKRERAEATFEIINRGGTANVAAAAREQGVGRIVHLSALGAGPSAPRYLLSRWAGEEELRRAGIPHIIFRPSFLIGAGGGVAAQLADVVRLGPWYPVKQMTGWEGPLAKVAAAVPIVPVLGSGQYRSMPLYIGDLMEAVTQSVQRDDVVGRTFEIGGPRNVTYDQLLDAVADAVAVRRRKAHLPMPVADALVWAMAVLPDPPITRAELDALLTDNVCDNTEVVRTFGLSLTPLETALRLALTKG